jgi:pectinesterase
LDLLDKYLQNRRATLTASAIQALDDCHFLASLNIDLLSQALGTVDKTSNVLPSSDADDVQTMLSAILTNQKTCFDGIQSFSTVRNDLSVPLSNGTNLHSVTLALFTKGWVPKGHKNNLTPNESNRHLNFRKGRLSPKMSSNARAVYDSVINRKRHLLQAGDDEVVVKDIAVVSQDGSGNFKTINDAINAAPDNSVASDGYFLIYITSGVYQEYVSITSKKKYLLLIGDGINQTIITGSHSVGDGSTTFNSSTFGNFPNFL